MTANHNDKIVKPIINEPESMDKIINTIRDAADGNKSIEITISGGVKIRGVISSKVYYKPNKDKKEGFSIGTTWYSFSHILDARLI